MTMAQVVAGIACSHVPMMASEKNWERLPEAGRVNLRAGFDRARQILEDSRPDILITFADDHFDRCFYDNLPAFLVGVGEEALGPAVDGFYLPKVRVPIASDLARFIVCEGLERGVDFAFSEELALDHAEMAPMIHLTPRWDIPIIPIVVNAFAPPMPTLKRCFDVGAFVGGCIERWPENKRIAVLGTGGLSHWVGPPETGRINDAFDRWFLERLRLGEFSEVMTRYARHQDLEAVAGNGGQEIRDWLAAAGAMPQRLRPQVLAYEPLKSWSTGTGIMGWSPA
jgi:aromatic ring-opening dioxygenase catalytic subunit (LigB family)